MTASTVTIEGVTYALDEYGFVLGLAEPEPGLAPFWWEAHPVNAEAAHEATLAMSRGQR